MAEGEAGVSIWIDDEGRLHVGIMANGRRIHRRLPAGASKGDAKQLEAELRAALGKRQPAIPGDPLLAQVMDLYIEHAQKLRSPDTAEYHALRTGQWVAGYRASEAHEAMRQMIDDCLGHYKPATINRSLGTVKKALTLAYEKKLIPLDYGASIKRLPENNEKHIYWTVDEVRKVADAASEQVRAAIWIALLTGCRRGEVLKIEPQHIGRDTITIKAGNTKTLRERVVPIVPALRPWLKYLPLQINFEGLKTGVRRARESAKMPTFTFHALRHSCASILINMSVPLEVIRDILGHTTVRTTERYSHLQVDRQREALEKLSALTRKRKKAPKPGANSV